MHRSDKGGCQGELLAAVRQLLAAYAQSMAAALVRRGELEWLWMVRVLQGPLRPTGKRLQEMLEALEAIMGFVLRRRRTGIKGPASAQEARLIYARCMGAIRKARGVDEASVPDCVKRLS